MALRAWAIQAQKWTHWRQKRGSSVGASARRSKGSCGEEPGSFPRCECFNALACACELFNFFPSSESARRVHLGRFNLYSPPFSRGCCFCHKESPMACICSALMLRCWSSSVLLSLSPFSFGTFLSFPLFASHNMDNVCFVFLVFVSLPFFPGPSLLPYRQSPAVTSRWFPPSTLYLLLAQRDRKLGRGLRRAGGREGTASKWKVGMLSFWCWSPALPPDDSRLAKMPPLDESWYLEGQAWSAKQPSIWSTVHPVLGIRGCLQEGEGPFLTVHILRTSNLPLGKDTPQFLDFCKHTQWRMGWGGIAGLIPSTLWTRFHGFSPSLSLLFPPSPHLPKLWMNWELD